MAAILILLIIAACAAFQYFKGTLVKSFAMIISVICASMVAFGYFELLANTLLKRGANTGFTAIVSWVHPLCFTLLFILAFAILQTIVILLAQKPVNLDMLPERIGRIVCGIFTGLLLSGLLLTVLDMAPLPTQYPYQRFEANAQNADNPDKAFLNADGFAAGWFSLVSRGSFSGKRSFTALHPDFLDQVYLNRLVVDKKIPLATSTNAIEVPRKKASWQAPQNLKDVDGKPIPVKNGHGLIIVRVGIKKGSAKKTVGFTLSQLRLICKPKTGTQNPIKGTAKNIFPLGFMKNENQLQIQKLSDKIFISKDNFVGNVRWIDFAFYVPTNFVPALVEFKQNNIAKVTAPVTSDQAPDSVSFSLPPEPKKTKSK